MLPQHTAPAHSPLTANGGDAVEAVAGVVLVAVVAHRAQVIVAALGTLPSDAKDGLLPASVTHGALVLHS